MKQAEGSTTDSAVLKPAITADKAKKVPVLVSRKETISVYKGREFNEYRYCPTPMGGADWRFTGDCFSVFDEATAPTGTFPLMEFSMRRTDSGPATLLQLAPDLPGKQKYQDWLTDMNRLYETHTTLGYAYRAREGDADQDATPLLYADVAAPGEPLTLASLATTSLTRYDQFFDELVNSLALDGHGAPIAEVLPSYEVLMTLADSKPSFTVIVGRPGVDAGDLQVAPGKGSIIKFIKPRNAAFKFDSITITPLDGGNADDFEVLLVTDEFLLLQDSAAAGEYGYRISFTTGANPALTHDPKIRNRPSTGPG